MSDYDFHNINDKEFESLVNDLLERDEKIRVSRYTAGKDSGIDGRFFSDKKDQTIIQSKHWLASGLPALLRYLKNTECKKVNSINPDRYIIATSLPLSVSAKNKIKLIFDPYIKSDSDILGKDDINSLISKYPEIENKYFKLWISSSNVLHRLINNAITARSRDYLIEIQNKSKIVVETEAFFPALEKLDEKGTIIITGEPGVGKTTLAEFIALNYVSHEFEFVMIEKDIREAEDIYEDNKKQLFYFDDFLGRNIASALEFSADTRIARFISRISRDKSKRFVLTSRTTVLNQKKSLTDIFSVHKLNKNEFEVQISDITKMDKARVLYNHLWYGNLTEEYIDIIYLNRGYLKVINHKNFNPRVISFITDIDRLENVPSDKYWRYVLNTLKNPEEIWLDVFDNQLDDGEKILTVLTTFNGAEINESDLKRAFFAMRLKSGESSNFKVDRDFRNSIRIAVGAVLNRIYYSEKIIEYSLFNPSLGDFIFRQYLPQNESLVDIFYSLKTVDSLRVLQGLFKSGKIDKTGYLKIYYGIINEIVNEPVDVDNFVYYNTLLYGAIVKNKDFKDSHIKSLWNHFQEIDFSDFSEQDFEIVCDIIYYYIKTYGQDNLMDFLNRTIPVISGIVTNQDECISLVRLIDEISVCEFVAERERVCQEVYEDWKYNVEGYVTGSDIGGDVLDNADSSELYQEIYDFVEDQLSAFDFGADVLSDIVDQVDLNDVISHNLEVRADEYPDEPHWHSGRQDGGGDTAEIDDLFERDKV